MHDRKAFTESGWEDLLAEISVIGDPANQETRMITSRKKSKGGELSVGDKANNKFISSLRSAVERCIAHLENWKILATVECTMSSLTVGKTDYRYLMERKPTPGNLWTLFGRIQLIKAVNRVV